MPDLSSRLEYAEAAVRTYVSLNGSNGRMDCDIIDLVTDLLHLAEIKGADPMSITRAANLHLKAESSKLTSVAGEQTGQLPDPVMLPKSRHAGRNH